jgi:hypothetical protein
LDLSSVSRQRDYKSNVPFVHVPIELLEQWAGAARMLRELAWYRGIFRPEELATLRDFDAQAAACIARLGEPIPDVPAIFERRAWTDLAHAAADALSVVGDDSASAPPG